MFDSVMYDSELAGRIMLKTWHGHVLEFHQRNGRQLQEIGRLGDPNLSCHPAISKGQGKYTELIQCFP